MYYGDSTDIEELGRDRFVSDTWEAIFVGYGSTAGIRSICRRWSDLLQAGLGCSQDVADELVRGQVMLRQDRDLMTIRDAERRMQAMDEVLADIGADLADLDEISPADRAILMAAHRELRRFLRDGYLGPADGAEDADGAGPADVPGLPTVPKMPSVPSQASIPGPKPLTPRAELARVGTAVAGSG